MVYEDRGFPDIEEPPEDESVRLEVVICPDFLGFWGEGGKAVEFVDSPHSDTSCTGCSVGATLAVGLFKDFCFW